MKEELEPSKVFEELSGGRPIEMSILRDSSDRVFRDRKSIRFVYHDTDEIEGQQRKPCLRIILDNRVSLWFFKYEGIWRFDGWEMGDYSQDWLQENL